MLSAESCHMAAVHPEATLLNRQRPRRHQQSCFTGTHQVARSDDALAKVVSKVLGEVAATVHPGSEHFDRKTRRLLRALSCISWHMAYAWHISATCTCCMQRPTNSRGMTAGISSGSLVDGELHSEAVPVCEQQDPGAIVPVGR